jgi:hypothetical protein
MKYDFAGSRWFILLMAVVLPFLLLVLAMAFNASICYIMLILVWIGMALMFFYLPKFRD